VSVERSMLCSWLIEVDAANYSSPSSSISILRVSCFHFFLQISLLCILWSELLIPLCPLGVHFNTCLAMRSSLRLNLCPIQFHFFLHICISTGSWPVSRYRSSLAILFGQCTRSYLEVKTSSPYSIRDAQFYPLLRTLI